ncbi:hypothetical protein DB346_09760 [Verrucomicrobia bacterium LW23]|nr:hypothetical protein DB346_09760 [Verrucomicrobia bacterium LW23]
MSLILIVDDESDVRTILRERIESMGHTSAEAAHAADALQLLQENQFDCVALDLCIPNKFQGPSDVYFGRNLLQRIVADSGPPVLIITGQGLNGPQTCRDMLVSGAIDFVPKPFDHRLEEGIALALKKASSNTLASGSSETLPLSDKTLVMYRDRIELGGVDVGGTRECLIRRLLPELARKNAAGHYIKSSRKALLKAAKVFDKDEAAVSNAIKEFREKCVLKLQCGMLDVIITERGGGLRLAEGIEFRIADDHGICNQAEKDEKDVLQELKRFGSRTCRQIALRLGIEAARVRSALSKLDDAGKVTLAGVGANTTYMLKSATP